MNKKDMRNIMESLAEAGIQDEQVLRTIKVLAERQGYKKVEAYNDFCINCAIYYTSSMFAMTSAYKRGLDMCKWSDGIMDTIYGWSE